MINPYNLRNVIFKIGMERDQSETGDAFGDSVRCTHVASIHEGKHLSEKQKKTQSALIVPSQREKRRRELLRQ